MADTDHTYYRRTYVVRVLSEERIPDDMDIADVLAAADSGAYVADWEDPVDLALSTAEAARALARAGSDPAFFGLDDVDPPAVADLHREVTDAILEAAHLDAEARAAHRRVSELEEALAVALPDDSVDGAIARRGAVRAAAAAGDRDRAAALAARFALDPATLNAGRAQPTVTVRFTPQAWVNGQAITIDPAGPVTFTVPAADAQDDTGGWLPDHSHHSDGLKDHAAAPEWIRAHRGPFEITIDHEAHGAQS